MSAFRIGGFSFRPASGVAAEKKVKPQETAQSEAPRKGAFDTANVNAGPLAVMPRMSAVGDSAARQVKGGAVETLLRDSAEELDGYFARAYGFEREPEE